MPRPCTICRHPEREAIDRALVAGTPLRKIAEHYSDTSITALFRHKSDHLPPYLTKAREAQEAARADSLLEQVRSLQEKTLGILEEAEKAGDHSTALRAIREARGNLELLARLLGELQEGRIVNILVTPEWMSLRAVILAALEPYLEARLALVRALEEVERGASCE